MFLRAVQLIYFCRLLIWLLPRCSLTYLSYCYFDNYSIFGDVLWLIDLLLYLSVMQLCLFHLQLMASCCYIIHSMLWQSNLTTHHVLYCDYHPRSSFVLNSNLVLLYFFFWFMYSCFVVISLFSNCLQLTISCSTNLAIFSDLSPPYVPTLLILLALLISHQAQIACRNTLQQEKHLWGILATCRLRIQNYIVHPCHSAWVHWKRLHSCSGCTRTLALHSCSSFTRTLLPALVVLV